MESKSNKIIRNIFFIYFTESFHCICSTSRRKQGQHDFNNVHNFHTNENITVCRKSDAVKDIICVKMAVSEVLQQRFSNGCLFTVTVNGYKFGAEFICNAVIC